MPDHYDEKDYEENRRSNRPKFGEREKFGTEFMDNLEQSAVGKFFDLSGERQAVLDQASREGKLGKVSQFTQKIEDKVGEVAAPVLKPVGAALGKISDVTQIDERISTPLTFVAAGAAAKGLSKIKPKHLGIQQTIEPYTPPKGLGKTPRKMVNVTNQVEDVFNMRSSRVQEIVRIAKKNKISYTKAEQYVNLKEKGIIPSETINPGTNAGIIEGDLPLNKLHARLIKQGKRGLIYDKDGNPIDPKLQTDPKDIPRTDPGMWMTAGRQAKPLRAKFFDEAGWKGGRLNLKSWRESPGDGKAIAELFLTAQGKGVVFKTEATKQNSFMSRVFGIKGARQLLGLSDDAKNIFQAHHITATKAVLTGQEGLVYDSPYYHEIQKVWEDLELTLGNNPDNIIGTLGLVQRDLDSPHSLIHKFLDSKMGPDGTAFWTPEKMNQIVIYDNDGNAIGHKNFKLRKKFTKEQALIFKEAVDLLKLAHEQYYLAKGVRPGEYLTAEPILDKDIVDAFINKLPPKGGTGKYTTNVIKKIAKEIAEENGIKPTISDVSIQDILDERFQGVVDTMYKFAVNESNGEEMLLDVIFNGLTSRQAVNKWKGNNPSITQLSIRFHKALKEAKTSTGITILKELYMRKYGEIPPAENFDFGRDD